MEREVKKQKRISTALLICILAGMLLLVINVKIFNSQKRSLRFTTSETDSEYLNSDIQILISPRGGSTDSWIKRIAVVNETGAMEEFQYAGIIYDIMIVNQSSARVENWSLIKGKYTARLLFEQCVVRQIRDTSKCRSRRKVSDFGFEKVYRKKG